MKNAASGIPFETLERDLLSNRTAHRLLTLIKERRLRPGDCLPPERELARNMSVSGASLREALRIMNIVENRRGTGTCVTSLEPERLIEHLDIVFALDESAYADHFSAGRIFEPKVATLNKRDPRTARGTMAEQLARIENGLTNRHHTTRKEP